MKKKILLFVGFCVLNLCIWEAQAVNTNSLPINMDVITDPPYGYGYEEIDLQGSLMFGIGPNAINAGANKDAVYIQFNQNFGNIDISIYNENNQQIYNCNVDTSIQQIVIIPLTNTTSSQLTVVLSNTSGYAEGDFRHN